MLAQNFDTLRRAMVDLNKHRVSGAISLTSTRNIQVKGLDTFCQVGDLVRIHSKSAEPCFGEVLSLRSGTVEVLPENGISGLSLGDKVTLIGTARIQPDLSWLGRVVDPLLRPLDGRPLVAGPRDMLMKAEPPSPTHRKKLGARIQTGLAVIDTMLPLVRGQRTGIFAGSGVGKSTLLSDFAKDTEADVVVIALVGERGREIREFVEDTLGEEGMKKSILVVATSDRSAMIRRRSAWVAMAVAEYFRDIGKNVLFLMDSVTRFAEAHREIVTTDGTNSREFPSSTFQELMALCERAGPGARDQGDITAIFSVLVEGSNMEGPIADAVRGLLDGHIILDRKIAERGRFPAIDLVRSVSRSLPKAASESENELIARVRSLASEYEQSKILIQSGLYETGTNRETDRSISFHPKLEGFISKRSCRNIEETFVNLRELIPSA